MFIFNDTETFEHVWSQSWHVCVLYEEMQMEGWKSSGNKTMNLPVFISSVVQYHLSLIVLTSFMHNMVLNNSCIGDGLCWGEQAILSHFFVVCPNY